MRTVKAYAAPSATEPLVPTTIERRDVGPKDVMIDIAYAGICHSDIHTVRGEWGEIQYPQVVGHEIVGHVSAVGSDVTEHQVGDRVGVGCMVNSCGECEQCVAGQEQYCLRGNIGTYASVDPADGSITQGGYSEAVVVNEDFVLRVPESLDIEKVVPLLCAGITTYSPLHHWGVTEGTKVAIVGMGGLGHMGVKIAAALGADVTVLSQTTSKKDDSLRFGAKAHYATSDEQTFTDLANSFDLIINTVSAKIDMGAYLGLLAVDGTLVNALLHHCAGRLSGIGGVARPGIVHRIDKDTSGLLVVAKTDVAHEGLARQFQAHTIERRYLAAVGGRPAKMEGTVDAVVVADVGGQIQRRRRPGLPALTGGFGQRLR